jgi:Bardet-Biedl syndrome 1 protein
MISDHALLDVPVAIACYYPDNATPRTPSVAVAAGPHIFVYRNLRPHYKFTVPPSTINSDEQDLWEKLRSNEGTDVRKSYEQLVALRDSGVQLSSRSLDLLVIDDEAVAVEFVEAEKHSPLQQQTVITCMETLNKTEDAGETGMSQIIIGTENKMIYILKPSGYSVSCQCELPSVPVMMAVTGSFDVNYRIVIACRDAKIYTIKVPSVRIVSTIERHTRCVLPWQGSYNNCECNAGTSMVIELESQPCGLVRAGKGIMVGCMGNQLHSYHIKGKKNFTVYLPSHITNMEVCRR